MKKVKESGAYDSFVGKKVNACPQISNFFYEGDSSNGGSTHDQHWNKMPEFENNNNDPYKHIKVSFRTEEDFNDFQVLIGQKMSKKTKSIWHPKLDNSPNKLNRWIEIDE